MNKLNKNNKKKNKNQKKKKTRKKISYSNDLCENDNSKDQSYSPHKNITDTSDESNKWNETLINETKKYDLDISSNKSSSSYSSQESNNIINENKKDIELDIGKNKTDLQNDQLIGTNLIKNNKEDTKENPSNTNDNIKIFTNNLIQFNGMEYKNYQKVNKYNKKRKIKKVIYKCKNYRKDEKLRIETNQKRFCDDTLEYIEPGQNVKSGYFLKRTIH